MIFLFDYDFRSSASHSSFQVTFCFTNRAAFRHMMSQVAGVECLTTELALFFQMPSFSNIYPFPENHLSSGDGMDLLT